MTSTLETKPTPRSAEEERLIELVRRHTTLDAPGLLEAIVTAVKDHSGAEQFDDLTLIVARVR